MGGGGVHYLGIYVPVFLEGDLLGYGSNYDRGREVPREDWRNHRLKESSLDGRIPDPGCLIYRDPEVVLGMRQARGACQSYPDRHHGRWPYYLSVQQLVIVHSNDPEVRGGLHDEVGQVDLRATNPQVENRNDRFVEETKAESHCDLGSPPCFDDYWVSVR